MQTIYGDASNLLLTAQKRPIRPYYAQTQATPYACSIDPSLRNTDGSIRVPTSSDSTPTYPLARSANVFTYQGSIVPGTVLVKTTDENVCIANGANAAVQPFGLLAQWIGGTFDNLFNNNEVAAWRGPDSVFELLAPAWNDTGLASAVTSATAGSNVYLYAGTDGRLTSTSPGGSAIAVATVISRPSAAKLIINLLI